MEQAYFRNIKSEIIPLLDNAQQTIHIAMAWFTSHDLFDTITNCLKRGVNVDLVLLDDAINWMPYAPNFNEFVETGGIIRIASSSSIGFMHHKFCVIDNKTVITGSYNWTYYAETRNIENIIVTNDKDIVNQYKTEFIRLADRIAPNKTTPRYTWDDINEMEYIEYRSLNTEIRSYANERNISEIPQFRPTSYAEYNVIPFKQETILPTTTILSIKKMEKAKSNYDIGIVYVDDNGNEHLCPLINNDEELPAKGTHIFLNNWDEKSSNVYMEISRRKQMGVFERIALKDIREVLGDTPELNMEISISMSLTENGYLNVAIRCDQADRQMNIQLVEPGMVKYEAE